VLVLVLVHGLGRVAVCWPSSNCLGKTLGGAVGVVTGLRAGLCGVRIPTQARDFSQMSIIRTGCGTHPAASGDLFRSASGRGVMLTIDFHLVPRLRMSGVIHDSLPPFASMTWR
jgi:hypothetical protein